MAQKVKEAVAASSKELSSLKMENASLKDKISAIESSNSDLVEIKKQLLDKIDTLEDDLAFYAKGQDKE